MRVPWCPGWAKERDGSNTVTSDSTNHQGLCWVESGELVWGDNNNNVCYREAPEDRSWQTLISEDALYLERLRLRLRQAAQFFWSFDQSHQIYFSFDFFQSWSDWWLFTWVEERDSSRTGQGQGSQGTAGGQAEDRQGSAAIGWIAQRTDGDLQVTDQWQERGEMLQSRVLLFPGLTPADGESSRIYWSAISDSDCREQRAVWSISWFNTAVLVWWSNVVF